MSQRLLINAFRYPFITLVGVIIGFFVWSNYAHADTYNWQESGVTKSTVTISTTTLSINGGSHGHLFKQNYNGTSSGSFDHTSFTIKQTNLYSSSLSTSTPLSPDSSYFAIRTDFTNANTAIDNVIAQSPFPNSASGLYGYVFFMTNSSGYIKCYSVRNGAFTYGAYEDWQTCEHTFSFSSGISGTTTSSSSSSSTTNNYSTTTVNINTGDIEFALQIIVFFLSLWWFSFVFSAFKKS